VIREGGLWHLAESKEDVVRAMTFPPHEPAGFHRFLDKFKILDDIIWTEDLIDRSIKAVCDDLKSEGIDYTWIRFSINKYMTHLDWHKKDAILFVVDAFDKYAPGIIGPVLSLKYESQRASQRRLASIIDDPDIANALDGLDLVGDEGHFDAEFYAPIFDQWKKAGKRLFAHVGESQPKENIVAVIKAGVFDICHGIKIVESGAIDADLVKMSLDNDVCYHLAISSNILTGVLESIDAHPVIDMLKAGLNLTIGTDDPVPCSTTLMREYELLYNYLKSDGVFGDRVEDVIEHVKKMAVNRVWGNIP